jgi:hypothetical protein
MFAAFLTTGTAHAIACTLLALTGGLGLVALLSPRLFQRIATKGSHWIDTQKLIEQLDRRYDVDRYVLPHSRLLGALVVASVVLLAGLLFRGRF